MSNSKNYNSIVFLTTLSVYLGLVLIGAPPILAHAAMTRHFDIQNEIEVKDDLDKKPDGNPNFKEIDLSKILIGFLADLQELKANEPNIYQQEKYFYARRERIVYADNLLGLKPSRGIKTSSKLDDSFETFFNALDNKQLQNLADFLQESISEKPSKYISYEFYSALSVSAKLLINFKKTSPESASLLTDQLNMEFQFRANKTKQKFVKLVYENTKAVSESNQVTIVTRLPRGSLDALLTRKDAQ